MGIRWSNDLTCWTLACLALACLGSAPAQADQCSGKIMGPGASCSNAPVPIAPGGCAPPPGCDPHHWSVVDLFLSLFGTACKGMSLCNCEVQPDMTVVTFDGQDFCVPIDRSCKPTDSRCREYPIDPKLASDPNDKVGTLGAGASGFVASATGLDYLVHFENLSTATGPAAVVVVTDQLDPARVDLRTFELGPISFGQITLRPASGTQEFTGGVDLRPEQDLLVTVNANLDQASGLVTWRFTSLDPTLGQVTEDPAVGFLPPNTQPPAGEGSVMFRVAPAAALATGTPIPNHALVVFDANAPISTPVWLNTIDKDAPVTHVVPLPATEASPTFAVQWTGNDSGSGIGSYSVYVSDNGAAFSKWLDDTTATSGSYPGASGHRYEFYSVGVDRVGNMEPLKVVADAATVVGTVAPACASDVDGQIQVTRSGFGYNFTTRRFVQTVSLKNVSGGVISGPISVVLDHLSGNASLFNASAATACALPAGSPFVDLSGNLGPGASGTVTLQFTNPTRAGITYVPRVLAGSAAR